MANAIFQAADENILRTANWAVTAGSTVSHGPLLIGRLDPAVRVLFTSSIGTLIATIPSARGDVLAIPVTNASLLTVTNGSGLNVSVPVPALPVSGIPLTLVCDLSLLAPNPSTRTSTTWGFAFASSVGGLVLGAAIALYAPRRELVDGDFQWGGTETRTAFGSVQESPAGVRWRNPRQTQCRSAKLTKLATQDDADAIQGWFDGSRGQFDPALLWPDPAVNDAYFGTLGDTLEMTRLAPTVDGPVFSVSLQFDELAKGRPVA